MDTGYVADMDADRNTIGWLAGRLVFSLPMRPWIATVHCTAPTALRKSAIMVSGGI
jgi:hypothetical protein